MIVNQIFCLTLAPSHLPNSPESMTVLLLNILQGITAFIATNLDDIVVLMVFFNQINKFLRPQHIVSGQYLGFGILLLLSLPGYFGGMLMPQHWIGLLGLVPLGIGCKLLFAPKDNDDLGQISGSPLLQKLENVIQPQILQVAAVTVANGGDNIGIYVPLFASKNLSGLLTILGTFLLMVGLWCWIAGRLVKQPIMAQLFNKYGDRLIPWLFIALGCYILSESGLIAYLRTF
jgi:cadmium resistance transport/sequestration family protein